VVYLDTDRDRLALAETLGATAVEGPPPHRTGPYPITVNASADRDALACALRSTESGGVCTSVVTDFEPETPIPLLEMYTTGMRFHTGICHARGAIPEILDLVAAGRLHPELVTSHVAAWDDADQAVLEPQRKLVIERAA
jgi:alcohol dehydrogenase